MAETSKQTYDFVCFSDLAYEFDFCDLKEAEKKIKQKLRYYGLGKYDQGRVDYIRNLKNDLFNEIRLYDKSEYYNPSKSEFAEFTDFFFVKSPQNRHEVTFFHKIFEKQNGFYSTNYISGYYC